MPIDPLYEELRFNLLQEPLIRWRDTASGALQQSSLPELMAAMAADRVRDFPALRAHQRHVWHAFLVQLAAIALHHAGHDEVWSDASDWRQALLALTPDDADGAAWCLVAPAGRPAFLQAPFLKGIKGWDGEVVSPDMLDMLGTSKAHDLKRSRMRRADPNDWLFALLSLQTQAGGNSGSYKGISRMNSNAGSRPGVGVTPVGSFGMRWQSDVSILLNARDEIAEKYGLAKNAGIALVWLLPWDESTSIDLSSLDPFYIEICRRVRLQAHGAEIIARTTKTPVNRISESSVSGGVTGDPWTPVDAAHTKIMAVPKEGFNYQLVSDLLTGQRYAWGASQSVEGRPLNMHLELWCSGIAPNGMSKTSGYWQRKVPISPKMRRLLAGHDDERAVLAETAKRRIDAIAALQNVLRHALALLFSNGKKNDISDSAWKQASLFAKPFEQSEDSRFFADLTAEIEADEADRSALHLQWQDGLAQRAEAVLRRAFDAGPRSGVQRYKARSAALARFHGGLRGSKPILPDLAHHYQQQRGAAPTLEELPS